MGKETYQLRQTCNECPWRKDVEPGRFPPERFYTLARNRAARVGQSDLRVPQDDRGEGSGVRGLPARGGLEQFLRALGARSALVRSTRSQSRRTAL